MAEQVRAPGSRRYASLDTLRGVAAVVVVLHHAALTVPVIATAFLDPSATTGWVWWLTNTPLRLVWAGREAVYLFFVLSGFVLVLPFLGGGRRTVGEWGAYYRKRLLRLYLPVWGAVLFALVLWAVVGRSDSTASWWVNEHAARPTPHSLFGDFTLTSTSWLNSALWSLKWEVEFSVFLPVYVVAALVARRLGAWTVAVPLALVGVGVHVGSEALTYLPMFLTGSVLAATLPSLLTGRRRLTTPGRVVLGVITLALLSQGWWAPVGRASAMALTVLGAALTLFLFLESPGLRRVAGHVVPQALGRWSFSLYLVHVPVLVTVVGALTVPLRFLVPVGLALSLASAALFHRFVESPALAFARWQGERGRLFPRAAREPSQPQPRPQAEPHPQPPEPQSAP